MNYSAKYQAVLRSPRWRKIRGEAIRRAGNRCQRCGQGGVTLDGHHARGYDHLGHERAEEIRALCRPCHNIEHRHRRRGRQLRGTPWSAWVVRRLVRCAFLLALAYSIGKWAGLL